MKGMGKRGVNLKI